MSIPLAASKSIPLASSRPIPLAPSKYKSFDPLIREIHETATKLPDARVKPFYTMADAVLSAVAMFSLKDASLLAFQERRNDQNMKNIYRIQNVPSDTTMREILDPVEPDSIRPFFQTVYRQIQRGGGLKPFVFHDNCYLLSLDGTEYFSSKDVHCPSCMERKASGSGAITYHHQMLAAVLVHPDQKQVIPFAPEPIVKQDGKDKNDCERNAAKRLLTKIRNEHPHLHLIVVEDGLASNAPHIQLLKQLRMHFILGAKPDDHQHLFAEVIAAHDEHRAVTSSWACPKRAGVTCETSFVNNLPLNKTNSYLRVNFFQYSEYNSDGDRIAHFSWVTDLTITAGNVRRLCAGGRSRWKIENETFNTLKNQGYQFEHNFGHGNVHLSEVLAMLMMLTFLIDQTQEQGCPPFQAMKKKFVTRRSLWDHIRSHFRHFEFTSMQHLYEVVLYDLAPKIVISTNGLYGSRVTSRDMTSRDVTT